MTITVSQKDQALEEHTREAWQRYVGRVRNLVGAEYMRVESESWDELQADLAAHIADHALAELNDVQPTS